MLIRTLKCLVLLAATASSHVNVPPDGYYVPEVNGGSMLTKLNLTYPMGQGEPLNVIISGWSDPRVLVDSKQGGGLKTYFESFGFATECLGQISAALEMANLGDGNGYKNETAVMRWDYGDRRLGTCLETVKGGNHFRYWTQDGPDANSSAIFMAVSYELPVSQGHDLITNGYNLGRDWLIGNITQSPITTKNLSDGLNFTGTTKSASNYTYTSSITYKTGLLNNTNDAINHNITVGINHENATDGFAAIIEVQLTSVPANAAFLARTPRETWHVLAAPLSLLCVTLMSYAV